MSGRLLHSRPVKMWIDGKVFNLQKFNENTKNLKRQKVASETGEGEEGPPEDLKLLDIKEENGHFSTSFKLPNLYYSKIQNLTNFSIEKLSAETKTKIFLPKTCHDGEITIHCDTTNDLFKAVQHIHSAIGAIREKNVPLQFICIPCVSQNIKERFEHLKKEILLMRDEIDGVHESIFMCPLKLHITIDVYALLDDRERTEAIEALKDYKTTLVKIIDTTGPLELIVAGLDTMNNNIKKVDVLFANVKIVNESTEHTLQKIVNDVSDHFYNRGLAKRYQDSVKLHMTVINTKYRKNVGSQRRKRRRQSIDATRILEKFRDYSFGKCDFDCIHLSHMTVKGEDGFYKPLAVINLNSNKDLK